jgi:hypothetical protein
MDERSSNSRDERLRSSGRLSRVVSQKTRAQARPSARGDEISFADLSREILATSSGAPLDDVAALQWQAEAEWGRERKGLRTAGGRVDER